MHYILYLSVSNGYLNDVELEKLLAQSRINNQKKNVTGVLLYGNGQFIQLLEGERVTVEQTFKRIRSDPRHSDVTIVASGDIRSRCFPEWFMGYKPVHPNSYSALSDFLERSRTFEKDNDELPIKLLNSFVRKNRLDSI